MDTLAVRLTLPTTKRVVDFHHQAIAHGGRTNETNPHFWRFVDGLSLYFKGFSGVFTSTFQFDNLTGSPEPTGQVIKLAVHEYLK